MSSVRSMLDRVRRLEQAKAPRPCPFEVAFGSLDAFEAEVLAEIAAEKLDTEAVILVTSARRWKQEEVWSLWRRERIWEMAR